MDGNTLHSLFKQEIQKYVKLLTKTYPRHGSRKPLTWYFVACELQVSEQTVRNYVERGKLKDLKITTLAEFVVMEDLLSTYKEECKK